MQKIVSIQCPKCNNNQNFHRYGKDIYGYQKYLCLVYKHQFAPENPIIIPRRPENRLYPSCPVYGKASFLHHKFEYHSNYRCGDKRCYHSFFAVKGNAV